MGKKHKKSARKKNHKNKRKITVNWSDKLRAKTNLKSIVDFSKEVFGGIKSLDTSRIKTYCHNHKKTLIFSGVMTSLVIGAFVVATNLPDKSVLDEANVMEVSLSDESELSVELGSIQNDESLVMKTVEGPIAQEVSSTQLIQADIELPETETQYKVDLNTTVEKDLYDSIEKSMMIGVDMYAIVVDNNEIAYFETEAEALDILDTLKSKYIAEGAVEEKVLFSEEVAIKEVKRNILDCNGYQTKEEVLEFIAKGTNEQRIHVVQKGENFWVIAEEYGLRVDSLIEANPGIDEKKLQIGTNLSLIVAKPIINVVTISTVERIDAVPYSRGENVLTDKYYVGQYITKIKGQTGEAEVTAEIYMQNGKVIGEKILDSKVIKEPVTQIVYQGTKPAPPKIGTGTFARPTSRGYITSKFGPRWGSFHKGVDIGIPMYTEVKAADGGEVTFSGYSGTYGKLLIINHGANKETRYAHNSVLKVKAGEKVFKGQIIALSGSTGRSTGPHLHFEIRVNGDPKNPLGYVSY